MNLSTIFIDTSIPKGFGYNFASRPAQTLVEIARREELILLLPLVTEKEILRHLDMLSNEVEESITAIRKKAFMLEREKPWLLNFGEGKTVSKEVSKLLNLDWQNFTKLFNVVRFPYADINLELTLDWWENRKSPFSEKKPREFADGFAASCLLKYQDENGSKVSVISNDSDWRTFCDEHEGFYFFESSYAYAEALNPDIKNILSIKAIVLDSEELQDQIKVILSKSEFEITLGWDAMIHKLLMIGLTFESVNVLNSEPNDVEIAFSLNATIEMDLEYTDVVSGDHILETPSQFETRYTSGVTTNGTASIKIDLELKSIEKIKSVKLQDSSFNFP